MLELVLVGQVLGRFWAGSAAVAQIPKRLHAGGLLGCFAVAAAVAPAGAAAAVAGVRGGREPVADPVESVSVAVFA